MSSEYGIYKTINARFLPWCSGMSPGKVLRYIRQSMLDYCLGGHVQVLRTLAGVPSSLGGAGAVQVERPVSNTHDCAVEDGRPGQLSFIWSHLMRSFPSKYPILVQIFTTSHVNTVLKHSRVNSRGSPVSGTVMRSTLSIEVIMSACPERK